MKQKPAASPTKSTGKGMLSYVEAFQCLSKRFPGLTHGELCLWVWQWNCNIDDDKGLPAYNCFGRVFYWSDASSLSDLRSCIFKPEDVHTFEPIERWLTYEQLVRRWQPFCEDPEHEIETAVHRHKDSIMFQAFDPLYRRPQPIKDCCFPLSTVEQCEVEWFPEAVEQRNGRAMQYRDYVISQALGELTDTHIKSNSEREPARLEAAINIYVNALGKKKWTLKQATCWILGTNPETLGKLEKEDTELRAMLRAPSDYGDYEDTPIFIKTYNYIYCNIQDAMDNSELQVRDSKISARDTVLWAKKHIETWDVLEKLPTALGIAFDRVFGTDTTNYREPSREAERIPLEEQRIDRILQAIGKEDWQPLSIPTGGKAQLKKNLCHNHPKLFTQANFDHAWKAARNRGLVQMAEHDKFAHERSE